jgi:hypothetical protein
MCKKLPKKRIVGFEGGFGFPNFIRKFTILACPKARILTQITKFSAPRKKSHDKTLLSPFAPGFASAVPQFASAQSPQRTNGAFPGFGFGC